MRNMMRLKGLQEVIDKYKKLYEMGKRIVPKFKEGDYVISDIYNLRIANGSGVKTISITHDNGDVDYMDDGDVCCVIDSVWINEDYDGFEVLYDVFVDLDCDQTHNNLKGKKGVLFREVPESILRKTDKPINNTFRRSKQVVNRKVVDTYDDGTTSERTYEYDKNERRIYYS